MQAAAEIVLVSSKLRVVCRFFKLHALTSLFEKFRSFRKAALMS